MNDVRDRRDYLLTIISNTLYFNQGVDVTERKSGLINQLTHNLLKGS